MQFPHVLQAAIEDLFDVFVVQGVAHFLSFLDSPHQPRRSQHAKLMGDGGNAHTYRFGDIRNVERRNGKRRKYFCARLVAENLTSYNFSSDGNAFLISSIISESGIHSPFNV